ncbi:OLC1v1014252C1 [Oldenlandia corymbosa var. corymbosa]|uniref:OLC1v1014252C1 n=1 Tax=Oldenlandia corymbosa var. corymbosa TaxID=529605 RepID=A0AAV1E2S8_OLDCO|nr:OLC1v1014252C1 [Oldenlandia corymbosa var. corymbosa]
MGRDPNAGTQQRGQQQPQEHPFRPAALSQIPETIDDPFGSPIHQGTNYQNDESSKKSRGGVSMAATAFPPQSSQQNQNAPQHPTQFPPQNTSQMKSPANFQGQPQSFPQADQPHAFSPPQEEQPQPFPPPQDFHQPPPHSFQHPNMAQYQVPPNFPNAGAGSSAGIGQNPINQSMQNQNPFQVQLNNIPTQAWRTELFGCMDDPTNAFMTACFPFVTFGQIAEILDNGQTSCATSGMLYFFISLFGTPCLLSCAYRTKLRRRFGLIETPAPDWLVHLCCSPCAICQEYRELQQRGLDPSIGWEGNVARSRQRVQMNMTPPMKQNMMA